ncbi:MAG: MBL fold metallo-hydrolase [Clostridia bacterium]|nr:MBL fold metallo-hydrolase [Clostridia bacterium]
MNFCTLASGSNGNSAVLINEDKHILIDAGYSNRALCTFMSNIGVNHNDVGAVFITHEHSDHIKGLSVFLAKHPQTICFASQMTAYAIGASNPEIAHRIVSFAVGDVIEYSGHKIKTIRTPHDTPESVAYHIEKDNKKILIATDLGYVPDEIEENLDDLDLFMIEANYDEEKLEHGKYPAFLKTRIRGKGGHLSNDASAEIVLKAAECGGKRVLLSHLSQENNTPRLAYNAVHQKLMAGGFIPGVDIDLKVSPRGMCGEVICL